MLLILLIVLIVLALGGGIRFAAYGAALYMLAFLLFVVLLLSLVFNLVALPFRAW